MRVIGFATVKLNSLACQVTDADWSFSIRRVDDEAHGPFSEFHDKQVSASEVKAYLPNWLFLSWTQIQDGVLSTSESSAKDKEFKVNVRSTNGGTKTHDEVVSTFLDFMRQSE